MKKRHERKSRRIKKSSKNDKEGTIFDYGHVSPTIGEVLGETMAKIELFNEKIIPYPRFFDVDGIDLVTLFRERNRGNMPFCSKNVRKDEMIYSNPSFNEVQIKYSTEGKPGYYLFNVSSFRCRRYYYFLFVCGIKENIFIIPSENLAQFIGKRGGHIRIKKEGKGWFMIIDKKRSNITGYLRNYTPLKIPNVIS